ncbi:hypothetical protein SAMN05421771_1068 [Granulicella pectinivorans]|uniref:Uncharacterized protein n=1 Tax=Granulicella pectinivorans TaxID=474950 RepID=A0A1I6LPV8_9BACT|nr:hypothetical protein [Granulicella pectinivorans]SFS05320.1 hypothetical protein SAMN05421771_1068 [Granulicella pectinivorans]
MTSSGKTLRLLFALTLVPSAAPLMQAQSPVEIIQQMVAHEDDAALHKQHFAYTATERSERTGNHLWKERIAETSDGKVRFLLEEDGTPLSPDRVGRERGRLAGIATNPADFIAAEHARKNDEDKAKAMLDLLPKAFLLENLRKEGNLTMIDFRPDPAYQTQSMEEKVLHGMSGTVSIDNRAERLHTIKASLAKDVSVGFGLATVHAGSSFATTRDQVAPGQWKTVVVDTAINGKAILFKSLGKNEHVERSDFKLLPFEMSVKDAVAVVEQ